VITDAYVLWKTTTGNGTLNGPLQLVVMITPVFPLKLPVLLLYHQPGLVTPTILLEDSQKMMRIALLLMTILLPIIPPQIQMTILLMKQLLLMK